MKRWLRRHKSEINSKMWDLMCLYWFTVIKRVMRRVCYPFLNLLAWQRSKHCLFKLICGLESVCRRRSFPSSSAEQTQPKPPWNFFFFLKLLYWRCDRSFIDIMLKSDKYLALDITLFSVHINAHFFCDAMNPFSGVYALNSSWQIPAVVSSCQPVEEL